MSPVIVNVYFVSKIFIMYSNFRLHAVGNFFEVDTYLAQYTIEYDSVWHRGEDNYSNSGFVKYLGNEFRLNSCEQEEIAIQYMQKNQDALQAVVKWKNVEAVILGISPEIQIDRSVVSVCLSFSSKLVTLAFYVRPSISFEDDIPAAEDWWGWQ